jgi:hypothetical protein
MVLDYIKYKHKCQKMPASQDYDIFDSNKLYISVSTRGLTISRWKISLLERNNLKWYV